MGRSRLRQFIGGVVVATAHCWALLLHGVLPVCAQQLSVRHYDVSDGLANSDVSAIHQDAKGYLWFGTREGLSRFDGYRFTNHGTRDGLGNPVINALVEDQQGRLWIGTNGGGVARLIDDPREIFPLRQTQAAATTKLILPSQLDPAQYDARASPRREARLPEAGFHRTEECYARG